MDERRRRVRLPGKKPRYCLYLYRTVGLQESEELVGLCMYARMNVLTIYVVCDGFGGIGLKRVAEAVNQLEGRQLRPVV